MLLFQLKSYVNFSAFTDKERKIYDLVVKRFLAVLFPAFEYEQLTLRAKIGDENFVARGKTILSMLVGKKFMKIVLKMKMQQMI